MSASQSHILCQHPATKSARAKCRAERKARSADYRETLSVILNSYYDNTGEVEEIAAQLDRLACETRSPKLLEAARGYYDESLALEDVLVLAHAAMNEI